MQVGFAARTCRTYARVSIARGIFLLGFFNHYRFGVSVKLFLRFSALLRLCSEFGLPMCRESVVMWR